MNPAWGLALTCAATGLLVGVLILLANDFFFRYRALLGERIDELLGSTGNDGNASLFKNLKLMDEQASAARVRWKTRLRDTLEQADLGIGISTVMAISGSMGIALSLVALMFNRWWLAPVGMAVGMTLPWLYVHGKRRIRMRRLIAQLPEAFDVIGRAVQAGQTVSAAFQIVADDFLPPISKEFRQCYEEQNLGMSYDATLRNLARRTGIMELRILVVALLIQCRAGGDLIELLNNLSLMVRNRIKLQQKVKALTGEGRMQATVLIVLPIVAFIALLVLSPQYIATLRQRPWMLGGVVAAQVVGALWIRRIANFEF